jgi:hypothetical protein
MIKKGDIVTTPFEGVGIITEERCIPWGFKYVVKMLRETVFYKENEEVDFREQDLVKIA